MGIQFGLTSHFHHYVMKAVDYACDSDSDDHSASLANNSGTPTASATSAALSHNRSFLSRLRGHEELLSAALGGAFAALFASPVELIMIQQQIFGGRFIDTPRRIVRDYGLFQRGIWRAVSVAALRDTIYVCGMLGVTPLAQHYLVTKHQVDTTSATLYASFLGGLVAALPSHPFDVVKTCMQGDLQQKEYVSPVQTLRLLWQQGGFQRLYAGCAWRTLNIVSTVYIANQCMMLGSDYARKIPI